MKNVLTALALFVVMAASAQKGLQFPALSGQSLDGKTKALPAANGKFSIIGIAFNRAAETELRKWLNPMYYNFIKKGDPNGQFDVAELYDVNFHFVPMISGFGKVADDFKNSTDKEFWPYIFDAQGDIKPIKKQLNITDDKIPYFFVLDSTGKIVEVVSGDFSEKKMEQLEDALD